MSFYWMKDNKIEIHTFESLSLREQEEVTKAKLKNPYFTFLLVCRYPLKGAPHIFECVVGLGGFSYEPAKPEEGKVVPLTRRAELYGLLRNPIWAKYSCKLDTTSMFSPSRMFLSSLLSFLNLQSWRFFLCGNPRISLLISLVFSILWKKDH